MTDPTTPEGRAVEHREDWTDYQPDWDLGPGCSCGFNGTYEECRNHRLAEADARLESIRDYARALHELAQVTRDADGHYLAKVYDDIATTLERKIGDRP